MQNIEKHLYCARHPADAMRHAMDLVSRGYVRHTSGAVLLAKAEGWAAKAVERYAPSRPPATEHRMRGRKEARVRMQFYPHADHKMLGWILLVSGDGSGPVTEQESLLDARLRRGRLMIGGYELIREVSKARAAQGKVGPSWTWRVAVVGVGDSRKSWGRYVLDACRLARKTDKRSAQRLVEMETRRPGFGGTLRQRRRLFDGMRKNRRLLVPRHGALVFPAYMPYYGRHSARCSLRELMLQQVLRGERSG